MLDHIIFVLYQPQDVVNVGGVARAMSNFGLRRLRLVEPAAFDAERIAGIAHQAEDNHRRLSNTTPTCPRRWPIAAWSPRRPGAPRRFRHARQTPRAAAPALLAAAQPDAPVAVLFGREDNGLPNSALAAPISC